LMKVDKMTMAHSIEARTPFLDHRLAEWALRIPSSLRRTPHAGKLMLKKIAERHLPASVVHRKKHPFEVPTAAWLRGSLREPLETQEISISRAAGTAHFPAGFQLLAAMNPCPAGLVCSEGRCRCRPDQRQRYQSRISGPLLDRIDLHVPISEVPSQLLLAGEADAWDPAEIRVQVCAARERQIDRQGCTNARLPGEVLLQICTLSAAEKRLLNRASNRYGLSARGLHRVLKVARSIADLAGSDSVRPEQLVEALGFRAMDWSGGRGAG